MDFLEEKTDTFLNSLGLGEVVFEPLGQGAFPDFSIGDRIAVECTRLVQVIDGYTVETLSISRMQSLENAFKTVKRQGFDKSYFVSVRYRISIDVRLMTKVVQDYLRKCVATGFVPQERVNLTDGLSISFTASSPREQPFSLGSAGIENSGGWLMDELVRQCQEAVLRKKTRATQHREHFSDFWLAVGSALTIGIGIQEVQFLRDEIKSVGLWSHLLLIDTDSPARSKLIRLEV